MVIEVVVEVDLVGGAGASGFPAALIVTVGENAPVPITLIALTANL